MPNASKAIKIFFVLAVLAVLVLVGKNVMVKRAAKKVTEVVLDKKQTGQAPVKTPVSRVVQDGAIGYDLLNGWNLVAFPVAPKRFATASELIKDVAVQGGYVTTVAYWDKDQWRELSWRADQKFGHDFKIQNDQAYFIRNHRRMLWSVEGDEMPLDGYKLELDAGWNAIAIRTGGREMNAENFLDRVNRGREVATDINRWWYGVWDPFVKRIYSEDNIETYGEAYPIEENRGYFVRLKEPATFQLTESER
ncbi:MAG: hypothetical protein D6698_16960 [Gammaproteobacteria bacterium]|nr:MAG: hypothetical protein D6698_16960 [Gammaproteobacteria bacterium]